jgi:hypothetical protein
MEKYFGFTNWLKNEKKFPNKCSVSENLNSFTVCIQKINACSPLDTKK